MIDEVVDVLRCLSDLGSCGTKSPRWYGRTRRIDAWMRAARIARRLCIVLGIAGLIVLGTGSSWTGGVMIGVAVAIPVLTLIWEFWLIGRGLMVLGPASWPPRGPKRG